MNRVRTQPEPPAAEPSPSDRHPLEVPLLARSTARPHPCEDHKEFFLGHGSSPRNPYDRVRIYPSLNLPQTPAILRWHLSEPVHNAFRISSHRSPLPDRDRSQPGPTCLQLSPAWQGPEDDPSDHPRRSELQTGLYERRRAATIGTSALSSWLLSFQRFTSVWRVEHGRAEMFFWTGYTVDSLRLLISVL